MCRFIVFCVLAAVIVSTVSAFGGAGVRMVAHTAQRSLISMEYIPEGFTKKQWEDLKSKEAENNKKNLGQLGVGKFKSRSFEAWQKSGGKHLFPVNPNDSKYEERPYMQRRGGDWEGKDLNDRGLKGFGQGQAYERLEIDGMYERAQKAGMLNSVSIFGGASLPWTNEDADKMNNSKEKPLKFERGVAGKKLSPQEFSALKANLVKPVITEPKQDKPKKKGLFGWF